MQFDSCNDRTCGLYLASGLVFPPIYNAMEVVGAVRIGVRVKGK